MHEAIAFLKEVLPQSTRYFIGNGADLRTNSLLLLDCDQQKSLLQQLSEADFFKIEHRNGFLYFYFQDEVLLSALAFPLPLDDIPFRGEETADDPIFRRIYTVKRCKKLCDLHEKKYRKSFSRHTCKKSCPSCRPCTANL